jgi:hypothetical protein
MMDGKLSLGGSTPCVLRLMGSFYPHLFMTLGRGPGRLKKEGLVLSNYIRKGVLRTLKFEERWFLGEKDRAYPAGKSLESLCKERKVEVISKGRTIWLKQKSLFPVQSMMFVGEFLETDEGRKIKGRFCLPAPIKLLALFLGNGTVVFFGLAFALLIYDILTGVSLSSSKIRLYALYLTAPAGMLFVASVSFRILSFLKTPWRIVKVFRLMSS